MKSSFAVPFVVGLAVVGIAVLGIVYWARGGHVDLPGKVLKVRTIATGDENSVAVVDFRVTNPSDLVFRVRTVYLLMENKAGDQFPGTIAAEVDAQRLFVGLPLLGQKYNPTLVIMENIAPHATVDRMIAAQFNAPVHLLEQRKRFIVRVEEMAGKVFDLSEN